MFLGVSLLLKAAVGEFMVAVNFKLVLPNSILCFFYWKDIFPCIYYTSSALDFGLCKFGNIKSLDEFMITLKPSSLFSLFYAILFMLTLKT